MLASVVITLGVVVLCTQWCSVAAARTIPTPIASEAERMGTDKVSQLLLEFERWRDPSVATRRHLLQQRPTQWLGWLGFIGQPDGDEEAVSHKCFITKTRVVNKGDSLLVEAFVPADVASSSQALLATVHWRVNWGEEKSMTMEEQGDQNNQRVFAATLPAAAVMQTGSMVRWRVGVREFPSQRLLCGTSREFPRVYAGGTVVDGMASPTQLPVLHWFVKDPGAATKDEDTPCSVYFRGEFYDDVNTHRRGAGRRENQQNAYGAVMTKDWDKHKFKLDFNGEVFSFADDQPRVEEINLQSHYIEPGTGTTYLRENLALKLFQVGLRENGTGWQAQKIGVPASSAVHIRLHQNGVFYGLYSLIEQVDDTFLRRYGLDADGGLWKAVHWKYSNLRAPDSSANCPFATPDYNRDARECPEIFRKAEGVDDTYDPLYTFAQGLNGQPDDEARLRFLLHNTDIAAVVNEMAGQALILHQDRCTKNYYLHRDAVSGLWRRIPWDVEAAFGQDPQVDGCPKEACYPDAEGSYGYCMLTCPKFTTPLFCSVAFPQDIYEANDAPSTYNHLVDAVVRMSFTREMYLARLRTLTNNFLRTGWLREQAEAMSDRISEDVKADAAIWQTGDHRSALQQLNEMLSERQRQLDSQYSWLVPPTADAQAAGVFVNPERFATSTNGIVEITNRADFAADLSGFVLQKEKWTQHSFPPGTVLPAKSSLYLCATMRCQETLEREQGAPVFAQQLQAPKQLPFQLSALKLQKLP